MPVPRGVVDPLGHGVAERLKHRRVGSERVEDVGRLFEQPLLSGLLDEGDPVATPERGEHQVGVRVGHRVYLGRHVARPHLRELALDVLVVGTERVRERLEVLPALVAVRVVRSEVGDALHVEVLVGVPRHRVRVDGRVRVRPEVDGRPLCIVAVRVLVVFGDERRPDVGQRERHAQLGDRRRGRERHARGGQADHCGDPLTLDEVPEVLVRGGGAVLVVANDQRDVAAEDTTRFIDLLDGKSRGGDRGGAQRLAEPR